MASRSRVRIGITLGDINGIGTEVALKAVSSETAPGDVEFVLVGDATIVRDQLEEGVVDGFVRTLRAAPESPAGGSAKIPLFVFHPAGGSTVASGAGAIAFGRARLAQPDAEQTL